MKQVRVHDETHKQLEEILESRKKKEPTKAFTLQSINAELIAKEYKREVK